MCSKSPDTSGVNKAAQQTSDTAAQALDWYKQEAARTQGQRDAASAADLNVSNAAAAQMNAQTAQAARDNTFLNDTVRPLQGQYISDASSFGSQANQDASAERAAADVRNSMAGQATSTAQTLARMGYNPAVDATKQGNAEALATAAAATQARERQRNTGIQLEGQASGLGTQVAGNVQANNTGAAQAGQVATGAGTASLNAANGGAALMGQGFGTAIQGDQVSGNLYGQSAQLAAGNGNAGLWGAIGSLGGAAISHYSSKKLKDSGAAMPDEMALDAVVQADGDADEHGGPSDHDGDEAPKVALMGGARRADAGAGPVTAKMLRMKNDAWKYHEGVSDGAVHVGPYAEEAQRHLGDKVAPGGRQINMKESADTNGQAIAELAARVKRLTSVLGARK